VNNVDEKIGQIIRDKRKSLKLTQADLAYLVGTTKQCIYYYEKGTRGLSMTLFFRICNVLQLNPNDVQRDVERR